jgi:hypothetical protein
MNSTVKAVPDTIIVTGTVNGTISAGIGFSISTSSGGAYPITQSGGTTVPVHTGSTGKSPQQVQNAVYAHLQAMRVLGHTRVTPESVSRALGISLGSSMVALQSLERRGVKRRK